MKRYKLEITVNSPFFSARDTLYRDTVDAANAIEMRMSEYFAMGGRCSRKPESEQCH